ncbi:alpha-L-rhamnosidase [Paenibacillus whitsoniae]|uniref:alpha-L-rhamnosidase n=1 Tax=Paenibacillus whitsoniae TaxID=2496558 RepID=UPI0013E03323|nr:alpha-L-rhamnosidase [Paenibacillus whitsoniae]
MAFIDMDTGTWKSQWIAYAECTGDVSPVFRKSFTLPSECKGNVYARISGLGFYVMKINGRRVGEDIMQPAFTAYDKTVLFNVYEVNEYLAPGANVIEVTLGNGWYNERQATAWEFEHAAWRGRPRMTMELIVNGTIILSSDSSWDCAPSGTRFNSLRCGETFDAGYEVNAWRKAIIVPGPGGVMKEQRIPPIRVRERIMPVSVVPCPLPVIYDFGVNLSGNVEIKVTGSRGSKVTIQYFELLRSTATPDLERYRQHVYDERFQQDEYVLSGDGTEVWHSEFGYHGFRYARIYGDFETLEVEARCFHTDLPDAGGLVCDNPLITAIHQAVRRSTLTNFHHIPTDCPHREKNGWTADAHLSCEQALYNFAIDGAYEKWLDDLVEAQRPNGRIPCIAPAGNWGYDQMVCGPAWDAALFVVPWQLYRYTGETRYLEKYSEPMEKYLVYLSSILDNGICRTGLGDWSAPPSAPAFPKEALLTGYAYHMVDLFGKSCGVLHKNEGQERAFRLRDVIKSAFVREYGRFQSDSQVFHAMKLEFGLTNDVAETIKNLVKAVELADDHIMGGIFCSKLILDALTDHGRFDLAYKIASQRDFPGWGYMTQVCAGTLGENWFGGSSMNHPMFSEIGAWYYKAVAGFRIDEGAPGFRRIRLAPHIPDDIRNLHAWHDTPFGRLEIAWDERKVTVLIPEGSTATLTLGTLGEELGPGRHSFPRARSNPS